MSSRNSGIWLGTQGVLALIRVAIWIADPAFDDHRMKVTDFTEVPDLSERQLGLIWYSQQARSRDPDDFKLPIWAVGILDETCFCSLHKPFVMAYSIHTKTLNPQTDLLAQLQNAEERWDMPERLFMMWVNRHTHPNEQLTLTGTPWHDYGARVIMNKEGECHVLPFWTVDIDANGGYYRIKVSGDLNDEDATVIHCARKSLWSTFDAEDAEGRWVRGWRTPIVFDEDDSGKEESLSALQLLEQRFDWDAPVGFKLSFDKSAIREEAIKTMDSMWNDLIGIFRIKRGRGEDLPDIFRKEKVPRHPTHTGNHSSGEQFR